jgi:hypothetical protein
LPVIFADAMMAVMKSLRLVVMLIASVAPAISTVAPAGPTSKPVLVPLDVCVTDHGIQENPRNFPATKAVDIAAADRDDLAAYTDDQGELYLLAPRGWTCQASIGADGNDYIEAYPQGEVPDPVHSWPKTAQAVTADFLPACLGCVLSQACTYFPIAEQQLVKAYGRSLSCPQARVGQLTDRLSSTVVAYEDPSGVKGTEPPSGGNYPANGIVTYKLPTKHFEYGSAMENCVLPPRVRDLCTNALNDFASEWDKEVAAT